MKPADREELLRRVTLGELTPESDEVRRAASDDPELARELAETVQVLEELERDAGERREVLAEALALESAAGEAGAAEFVRRRVEQARARRRARWLGPLVGAAALLLAFLGWQLRDTERRTPRDFDLGPAGLRCVEPVGEVEDFGRFEWEAKAAGGRFEVVVLDSAGDELWRESVRSTEWIPDPALSAGWPRRIEWEVIWFDATDSAEDQDSAEAWKRP